MGYFLWPFHILYGTSETVLAVCNSEYISFIINPCPKVVKLGKIS